MTPVLFEGQVGLSEADLLEAGERDGYAHSILFVHEFRGALDVERLAQAARWVGDRHESFRTAFVRGPAGWRRLLYAESPFHLQVTDLSAELEPEQAARAKVVARYRTPFDRAVPHLVQVLLLRLAADRYWFVSHGDHVAIDGVGFANCLKELVIAYLMLAQGLTPSLPPARQPREQVAENEALLAQVRAAPGPWWEPLAPDAFRLRGDASRPGGEDRAGGRSFFSLGDGAAVDALAQAQGVSRAAPLLCAMALGLREVACRPDVAFTMIRSGRRDAASRGIVGCLAWGDSFAVRIDEGEPFSALLGRADAFLQDTAPWRMLYIPTVDPPSRRLVLNINRYDTGLSLPELTVFPRLDVVSDVLMWAAHDLLVQIFPLPGALQGIVRYRASLLEPATVERFGARMSGALRAMVEDPTAPVRSLG